MAETTSELSSSSSFSVDLLNLCSQHVAFLKYHHQSGTTKQVTSESLRRYRTLWLPLIAQSYEDHPKQHHKSSSTSTNNNKDNVLIPPPDIAWLWHCHRLAPSAYQRFIETEFSVFNDGRNRGGNKNSKSILDLQDPKLPYETQSNNYTRKVWKRLYPKEPFLLSEDASANNNNKKNGNTREGSKTSNSLEGGIIGGYDLFASAKSQSGFLYQVENISIRKRFVEEYLLFLKLALGPAQSFQFVPTNEIDLVWHTHMTGAAPAEYKNDCIKICGRLFDHDDSLGEDRTPGGLLDTYFQQTGQLWQETYGDSKYTSRGGYRGEPPSNYFASNVEQNDMTKQPSNDVANVIENSEEEDKKDSSCGGKTCKFRLAVLAAILSSAAGAIVAYLVLSGGASDFGYICGSEPPSAEEIQARGVPMCLESNAITGPLCLRGGEDPNDPPVWCKENVSDYGSYFLWWSPCTTCGTAWRMDQERVDDKSRYKLPTDEKPGPSDTPPFVSNQWLEWAPENQVWESETITFAECTSISSVNENGIPDYCYDDIDDVGSIYLILVVIVLSVAGMGALICSICCGNSSNGAGGGGYHHSSGGGCGGGGGGGCGGGGGGCGGC